MYGWDKRVFVEKESCVGHINNHIRSQEIHFLAGNAHLSKGNHYVELSNDCFGPRVDPFRNGNDCVRSGHNRAELANDRLRPRINAFWRGNDRF